MSTYTWGISGPAFLLLYLLLAGALLVGALRSRYRRRHPLVPTGSPALDAGSDPYLIAYLGGGPNRALLAALGSLRADGLVRGYNRRCTRVATPPSAWRPALERAVLIEAVVPLTRAELVSRHSVSSALDGLRDDLVRRGLLQDLSAGRRRPWEFAMAALFLLGVARLLAGLSGAKPVGFLVLAMLLVAGLTVLLFRLAASARTARGDAELAELRAAHPHLSPNMKPDWTANGATAAALAVGLFGAGALWAADPAFAGEMIMEKAFGGVAGSGGSGVWASSGCAGASGFSGGGGFTSGGGGFSGGGGGGGCGGGGGGGGCGG